MAYNILYASSYDRGLQYLLFMWADIRAKHPDAQLHICYGWNTFDALTKNNPERQEWKKQMESLMTQDGVIHHGRLGKSELKAVRKQCQIWAYPTDFFEINCITALEAQQDGLVPVTMRYGALPETVGSGVMIDGDIRDKSVADQYLKTILSVMDDPEYIKRESKKAKKFASEFRWEYIAPQWTEVFTLRQPKVTIITPTIRKGFWNLMANNISKQTYKNVEWIVVDGHKTDRSEVMDEYCEKWGVKHKYLREKPRSVKRRYSLVNANNTGWMNASGELLVWLQDFVLMPEDGIERIVDIYLHNPSALIAPVDVYYKSKVSTHITSEDWFSGELDVVGEFHWENMRNKYSGIVRTENPFDFEMNYCAIPKKVVEMLNGWWEFIDDGLGYDNTDIATRAQVLGCPIIIDAENKATCIDHWGPLKDNEAELGKERTHNLNDARYSWMVKMLKSGKLPLVRDQKIDDSISLKCEIPKELDQNQAALWIRKNTNKLVEEWGEI